MGQETRVEEFKLKSLEVQEEALGKKPKPPFVPSASLIDLVKGTEHQNRMYPKIWFLVRYQILSEDEHYVCQFLMESQQIPSSQDIEREAHKKCRKQAIAVQSVMEQFGQVIRLVQSKDYPQIYLEVKQTHELLHPPKPYFKKVAVAHFGNKLFCTVVFFLTDPSSSLTSEQVSQAYQEQDLKQKLQKMARKHPHYKQPSSSKQGNQTTVSHGQMHTISMILQSQPVTERQTYPPKFKCQLQSEYKKCFAELKSYIKVKPHILLTEWPVIKAVMQFYLPHSSAQQKLIQRAKQLNYQSILKEVIQKSRQHFQDRQMRLQQQKFFFHCEDKAILFNSDLLLYRIVHRLQIGGIQKIATTLQTMKQYPIKVTVAREHLEATMWYQIPLIVLIGKRGPIPDMSWKQQLGRKEEVERKRNKMMKEFVAENKIVINLKHMMIQLVAEQRERSRNFYHRVMMEDPPYTTAEEGFIRGLLKSKQPPNVLLKPFILKHLPQGHNPIIYLQELKIFTSFQEEKITYVINQSPVNQQIQKTDGVYYFVYGPLQKMLFLTTPLLESAQDMPTRPKPFSLGGIQKHISPYFYLVSLTKRNFRLYSEVTFIMDSLHFPTCQQIYFDAIRTNVIERLEENFYQRLSIMMQRNQLYGDQFTTIECKVQKKQSVLEIIKNKEQRIYFFHSPEKIQKKEIPQQQLQQMQKYKNKKQKQRVNIEYILQNDQLRIRLFTEIKSNHAVVNSYEIQKELKNTKIYVQANKNFYKTYLQGRKEMAVFYRQSFQQDQNSQITKKLQQNIENHQNNIVKKFHQSETKLVNGLPYLIIEQIQILQQFSLLADIFYCSGLSMVGRRFQILKQDETEDKRQFINQMLKEGDQKVFRETMTGVIKKINTKLRMQNKKIRNQTNQLKYFYMKFAPMDQSLKLDKQKKYQIKIIQNTNDAFQTVKKKVTIKPRQQVQFDPIVLGPDYRYFQARIQVLTTEQFVQLTFFMPVQYAQPTPTHSKLTLFAHQHQYIDKLKKILTGKIKRSLPTEQYKEKLKKLQSQYTAYYKHFMQQQQKAMSSQQRLDRMNILKQLASKLAEHQKSANTQGIRIKLLNHAPVTSDLLQLLQLQKVKISYKKGKFDSSPHQHNLLMQITMRNSLDIASTFIFNAGNIYKTDSRFEQLTAKQIQDYICKAVISQKAQYQLFSILWHAEQLKQLSSEGRVIQASIVGQFSDSLFAANFKKFYCKSVRYMLLVKPVSQKDYKPFSFISILKCAYTHQQSSVIVGQFFKDSFRGDKQHQQSLMMQYKQKLQLKNLSPDQINCVFIHLNQKYDYIPWVAGNVKFMTLKHPHTKIYSITVSYQQQDLQAVCKFSQDFAISFTAQLQAVLQLAEAKGALTWVERTLGELQYFHQQIEGKDYKRSKRTLTIQFKPSFKEQFSNELKCQHSPYPKLMIQWQQKIQKRSFLENQLKTMQFKYELFKTQIEVTSPTGLHLKGYADIYIQKGMSKEDIFKYFKLVGFFQVAKKQFYKLIYKYEVDFSTSGTYKFITFKAAQNFPQAMKQTETLQFQEITLQQAAKLPLFRNKQQLLQRVKVKYQNEQDDEIPKNIILPNLIPFEENAGEEQVAHFSQSSSDGQQSKYQPFKSKLEERQKQIFLFEQQKKMPPPTVRTSQKEETQIQKRGMHAKEEEQQHQHS